MYRPKTWRSVLFIYLLQHNNFLILYTEGFSNYFLIASRQKVNMCAKTLRGEGGGALTKLCMGGYFKTNNI